MKRLLLTAAFVLCAVFTFAQNSSDEKTIVDLDRAWIKAAQEKNVDKAVSFYADDALLMPPGAPIATTAQQRRAVWEQLLSDPKSTMDFGRIRLEVSKSGDLAYDVGWAELRTADAAGKPAVARGKYIVVWKKIKGQWKVAADTLNMDQ